MIVFFSFITFRSCRNLDGKHSVFGKLVGGLDTLNELERIEVDNKDRPIEDIIIQKAQVFVDPFEEVDEQLAKERADDLAKQQKEKQTQAAKPKPTAQLKVFREGVGKYLNKDAVKADLKAEAGTSSEDPAAKKSKRYDFGNFKTW